MANLRAVIGKLNPTSRNALEGAAGLCLARTNYNVEVEHFLMKLLDASGADFALIARHFGIDKSKLAAELNRAIDKLKSGSARFEDRPRQAVAQPVSLDGIERVVDAHRRVNH